MTKHNAYTIALIQLALDGTGNENLEKCRHWVRKAAAEKANVICLPELCGSSYFCQSENPHHFDLAEPVDGPSFQTFGPLARELGVVIIVPFFERRAAGLYHNSACVIDADGTKAGFYRKTHIPDDPCYYEKFYFTPGDAGFCACGTAFGKIGVLICWDQWFPEAARITALKGAEVLFYPTAIGWHPHEKAACGERQHDAWETVQRGHAIANGLYVAAANRVGLERPFQDAPGLEFWGSSFIAGPQGEILARASRDREEMILAEVDTAHLEDVRRNWPFFRDRRIDAYGDILKRSIDEGEKS
jgi:N-carbamoylputrescine amidase